jgi:hypothetical protein
MRKVKITKAFGNVEPFDEEKLIRSLKRSGASDEVTKNVVREITTHLVDGMTTKEIYRQAFELMRQYAPPQAARYKLKQAINELGPSGFPFEQYVAELLKAEGYSVSTGLMLQGRCVKHEIDVLADKGEERLMVECKFHNTQGIYSDVKIPLYIQSRYLDVLDSWKREDQFEARTHQAAIYTNTRFTDDAITYARCVDIRLVSWDYPSGSSLRERINTAGLHPVTCFTTITSREKQLLLENKIVLCKQLCAHPQVLGEIGILSEERVERILEEGRQVCMLDERQMDR